MNNFISQFVSKDPVENVNLAAAQSLQAFGTLYNLSSSIAAVKINMDADSPWTKLADLQSGGLQDVDAIRFVLVFDQFPQDSHDVGPMLKNLTNPAWAPDYKLRQFVSDIANTLSTGNSGAGVDQDALAAVSKAILTLLSTVQSTKGCAG